MENSKMRFKAQGRRAGLKMGGDYHSLRYNLIGSPFPSIVRGTNCLNAGYKYASFKDTGRLSYRRNLFKLFKKYN